MRRYHEKCFAILLTVILGIQTFGVQAIDELETEDIQLVTNWHEAINESLQALDSDSLEIEEFALRVHPDVFEMTETEQQSIFMDIQSHIRYSLINQESEVILGDAHDSFWSDPTAPHSLIKESNRVLIAVVNPRISDVGSEQIRQRFSAEIEPNGKRIQNVSFIGDAYMTGVSNRKWIPASSEITYHPLGDGIQISNMGAFYAETDYFRYAIELKLHHYYAAFDGQMRSVDRSYVVNDNFIR